MKSDGGDNREGRWEESNLVDGRWRSLLESVVENEVIRLCVG